MNNQPLGVETRYAAVAEALLGTTGVTGGPDAAVQSKQAFGATALKINDKIFAMLSSRGEFVVKLPRQRVDALIAAGAGERFDAGRGRPMKEWLAMDPGSDEDWVALAREAMAYVGGR